MFFTIRNQEIGSADNLVCSKLRYFFEHGTISSKTLEISENKAAIEIN